MQSLPLIKVRGGPYERGLQHGRRCGDLIRRYPDVLLAALRLEAQWRAMDIGGRPLSGREELFARAMAFLPALERFASHLVEEVRGIADGARLSFAEVLLVNVRAEVMGQTTVDAGCTAFAVGRSATADGSILAGRKFDQHESNRDLLIILHVEPNLGPPTLMCSFAGLVGYPGVNAAGVSFFQNALSTPVWRGSAMPHYFLKRVLLEQTSIADCLTVARRAKVCSSANYGHRPGWRARPRNDAGRHRHDRAAGRHPRPHQPLPQSHACPARGSPHQSSRLANRAPRMETLLAQHRGRLTVEKLKDLLADHDNAPPSICRHQDPIVTIASMIAEPTKDASTSPPEIPASATSSPTRSRAKFRSHRRGLHPPPQSGEGDRRSRWRGQPQAPRIGSPSTATEMGNCAFPALGAVAIPKPR